MELHIVPILDDGNICFKVMNKKPHRTVCEYVCFLSHEHESNINKNICVFYESIFGFGRCSLLNSEYPNHNLVVSAVSVDGANQNENLRFFFMHLDKEICTFFLCGDEVKQLLMWTEI